MNRTRPLLAAALALVLALPAAAASLPTEGSAPFYTGKPTGAAFGAREAQRITQAKAEIAKVLAVKGPRTLANTLAPYDVAYRLLDSAGSEANLLENTSPDSATRAVAAKVGQDVSSYLTEISLNRDVYHALAALDVSGADAATRYYVTRTLRDFKLAGVDKDDATRARVQQLNDSLETISQEFQRNIRADRTQVTCTVAEFDGLPADFIAAHPPGADGRVTLGTDYTDYIPVMTYAKSDALRKRIYVAYNQRAWPANVPVLDRMRARRHELATLLGFTDFADYVTADKMVGSAQNAQAFIDRVVAASQEQAGREYQRLLDEARKLDPAATRVEMWQLRYLKERVRLAQYSFDSQAIRPYLPYDRVEEGVLAIASRLFDVQFKRVPDAPVWDPSVECYELWDGGRLAGRFYLDMHPRANKFKHAASFPIRTGIEGVQLPEAALVCNLQGGKPGDPGLCEFNDVNTFFHEFGHLLHGLFASHGRWAGIGGISTERDFVEAPSQMLEEWMASPEVLATFAKHYQSGEPIPAALVKQLRRANDFGKALDVRQQMVFAGMSLGCYDRDPATITTDALYADLVGRYLPFANVPETHFQCAFTHLENYSATYYTYMWSKVIAKDLYSQFDESNLLAPEVAKRYRAAVLAPGGSKPAAQLVSDFLGRPFDERAWKKWLDAAE